MTELRQSLRRVLESNQLITAVMPAAFVLVLLHPAFSFINSLTYISFYAQLRSVFYIAYVLGLLICFANELDWAMGAAFSVFTLQYIISFFKYFTINTAVYVVYYGVLAFFVLRGVIGAGKFNTSAAFGTNTGSGASAWRAEPVQTEAAPVGGFCPNCGKPIDPNGAFCPHCGNPYPANMGMKSVPVMNHEPMNRVEYSGPIGVLASHCGSMLALAFTCLLTANIVCSLIIAKLALISIISSIPQIIICVACWMIYVGCTKGALNESGFALIGGVTVYELVLCLIIPILVGIIGFILMLQGDTLTAIGIGLVIGAVIMGGLRFLFWSGLRKTTVSAKMIAAGTGYQLYSSLFCIVVVCLKALSELTSLGTIASGNAAVNKLIAELSYELSYATGSDQLVKMLTPFLNSLTGGGGNLAVFNALLGLAVSVCAAIILIQIRKSNHVN